MWPFGQNNPKHDDLTSDTHTHTRMNCWFQLKSFQKPKQMKTTNEIITPCNHFNQIYLINLLYANADFERKGGEWACLGHGTFISVLCRYSLTGKQQTRKAPILQEYS